MSAIVASRRAMHAHGIQLPLMISGTITDRSGRTLSGQTPAAFYDQLRNPDVAFDVLIQAAGDDLTLHVPPHVGDFFGTLVNQQHDHLDIGVQ